MNANYQEKRKLDLPNLVEELKTENLKKKDIVLPAKNLSFKGGEVYVKNEDGNSNLSAVLDQCGVTWDGENGSHIKLSRLSQFDLHICEKLGIPKRYYDRMNSGHLSLLDENVNHWLNESDKNYFLRMFVDKDEEQGFARALLSDRYGVLDNYDVLLATLEAVKDSGVNLQIDSSDITERNMYVRFTCPDIEVQAPELLKNYRVPGGSPTDGNTGIVSGFVIRNSEVGSGSFNISPRATVLACTNGMTFKDDAFNRVHLGSKLGKYSTIDWSTETKRKNYELIISQVKDAIRKFTDPDYLGQKVNRLQELGSGELKNPFQAVKNVCSDLAITEKKEQSILNYFMKGGDQTAFGISQALTFYAHKDATADEQFDLEIASVEVLNKVSKYDVPEPVKVSKSRPEYN